MESVSRIGVAATQLIFERMGFAFREQPIEDYGIDAIVEERESKNTLSGKLIGVQIKSGQSFFSEIKDGRVIFRGETRHYDYWINYSLPVIIVLYNPETEICVYQFITKDIITKTDHGWKIDIPLSNRLEQAAPFLKSFTTSQTEYQKRLSTLAFAKGLMELAKKERLIVEVMEWINKGSGRGEFIIKYVDDQGKEKKLYNKTILGFGTKSYEDVLPQVFPWADLKLDEYYYEIHGDPGIIESRRRFTPNIYPYMNSAGEVDWYRFLPVLNDVGNSFLTMDAFLTDGKMYNIKF